MMRRSGQFSRGFTLVEMLVVLVILLALTSVAVTSLEGVQDQSRYEATQRTMQNVEDAVLGPANQRAADGSPLVTGFVADVGRLPLAYNLNGHLTVQELWDNPGNLKPFGIWQAVASNLDPTYAAYADPEVFVPCGWRGPYLRLGIGQLELKDGWGNYFALKGVNRNDINAGDEASIIVSLGADNAISGTNTNDYNSDVYLNFQTSLFTVYPPTPQTDRYHAANVVVTVKDPANGGPLIDKAVVVVRLFEPNPATGGIKVLEAPAQTADGSGPLTFTFSDPSLTIGTRVIRAYQTGVSTKKSEVSRVVLQTQGNQFELNVR